MTRSALRRRPLRSTILSNVYLFLFLFFGFFFCFLCLYVASSCNALITFSDQELIEIGLSLNPDFTSDWTDSIPPDIARPPSTPLVVVGNSKQCTWHRERKHKQECRACYCVQLQKQQHNPLLPSIFLTNTRCLAKKTEEQQSKIYYNRFLQEFCLLIITESCLH